MPSSDAATDYRETISFALGWIQDPPGSAPDRDMHAAFAALDALVAERDKYRTALETIKRTTKSGGAEAIAREALS